MQISSLTFNSEKTAIIVQITDALDVQSLRLWTNKTYKNFSKAIDLTDKLTLSETENIAITLADIDEPYFDGIYFVEAEDSDEASIEYISELARYKECIVNRIAYLSQCNDCLLEEDTDLLNAASVLRGLERSMEIRFVEQIIYFADVLDGYCNSECSTCGKFSNLTTDESKTASDVYNVEIDGGSLDDSPGDIINIEVDGGSID